MRRPVLTALLLAAIVLGAAGCGDGGGGGGGSVSAVATTTQVADLVRNVGGGRVDVDGILPPNADPHGYEPRPSDAAALAEADLVVRSGGELDEWLDDVVDSAGGDAPQVTLIDSVKTIAGGHDGDVDPHWWQDPRNAILAVAAIRDALAEADPEGHAGYERRAAAYTGELRRLDAAIERCIGRVPADRRKLVTTHDALGYFADRYGIEVIGAVIPSLSTQAQPSARDVEALVQQIRDEGVEAIFPEAAVSQKLERAISREAGADVGGELWTDTLGPEGSGAETYAGAMRANAAALAKGMSGGSVSCSFNR
ncbi:MAG: zinc/manganese transport system substrate-binding protein [Thermoleophilaceae bacterium]|jgi:ABC-type Zn uptake system ZnuABC Zn-binding protein ZnuA|nr:zinc/manganese transport system substrate-binding protein [Thermoleophilaceae bacterium]